MKRVQDKREKGFCAEKLIQFCKRTDLHGYKYIVMEELTFAERCFWALCVAVSVILAAYFVASAYAWYARNPTVTVIESTHGPIWDVPFPAVTICDLNLVSKKAARNFADKVVLPSNVTADDVYEILRYAPLLTAPYYVTDEVKKMLYTLQYVIDYNNINPRELLEKIGRESCSNLVQRCMWKNTIFRCEKIFHRLYTYFGVCCVFNYYAVDIPEILISNDPFYPKKPRRVASCGYQTALTVLIHIDVDDYYSTSIASYGAMVIVDNAYNVPGVNSPSRLVNPDTEVFIALSPQHTYSVPGVARFSVDTRGCFYADEVKIEKFKYYSHHNCLMYENIQDAKNRCGCVPHYFILDEEVRICNYKDIDCLQSIKRPYEERERDDMERKAVKCLPDCEHYDYPLEVAMGVLSKRPPSPTLAFFKDVDLQNHSLVNVFFNDLVSTRYRRDVYLNWQNLLASFGGLLSLMLGFTLISGFDLMIFFTFRTAYDWWTAFRNGKDGNKVHASDRRDSKVGKLYVNEMRPRKNQVEDVRRDAIGMKGRKMNEQMYPPSYDLVKRY